MGAESSGSLHISDLYPHQPEEVEERNMDSKKGVKTDGYKRRGKTLTYKDNPLTTK